MAWNPAIPATNADLLSAPVRDNFSALDTALMAALVTLGDGSVLTKAAGPVITGVAAVATGAVLASAGVNTAPTWSTSISLTGLTLSGLTQGSVLFAGSGGMISQDNASFFFDDTNNNLRLFGGTVGTSGQKVLSLGAGTGPTTSPIDTVQGWIADMNTEPGSATWHLRDERGGVFEFGTNTAGHTGLRLRPNGSVTRRDAVLMDATGRIGINGAPLASRACTVSGGSDAATDEVLAVQTTTDNTARGILVVRIVGGATQFSVTDATLAPVFMRCSPPGGPDLGFKQIITGAVDSAGAGYRTLRIGN
jgi:hypothetical protein